jgi:hypothetical protein
MDFGKALKALKSGQRVTRDGWNGRGMFLVLVPGSPTLTITADRPLGQAMPDKVGASFSYLSHLDMWTADGDMVPWVASQTDILADDWATV